MPVRYNENLELQFLSFLKKNEAKIESNLLKVTSEMVDKWLDDILNQEGGYHDVTGNTATGFFVGAYVPIKNKMTLVAAAFSGEMYEPPTRVWLKEGEVYDLPYYYGGDPVEGKPFIGIVGERNMKSYEVALEFLRTHKPKMSVAGFIVGNSTDYASYLEARPDVNLITDFCQDREQEGWIVEMHGAE